MSGTISCEFNVSGFFYSAKEIQSRFFAAAAACPRLPLSQIPREERRGPLMHSPPDAEGTPVVSRCGDSEDTTVTMHCKAASHTFSSLLGKCWVIL